MTPAPVLLTVDHPSHGWLGSLIHHPSGAQGLACELLALAGPARSILALPDIVRRTVLAGLTPKDLPTCPARWSVLVTSDAVHVERLRHGRWGVRTPVRVATYPRKAEA